MANNKYNNSKIYKIEPIVEHEEHEIYIGSSSKKYLSQRFQNHKSDYKRYLNSKVNYITVFDLFDKYGVDNCKIYLLENFNCNNVNELRAKEGEYIKKLKCINKNIAGQTNYYYYYHHYHYHYYNYYYIISCWGRGRTSGRWPSSPSRLLSPL